MNSIMTFRVLKYSGLRYIVEAKNIKEAVNKIDQSEHDINDIRSVEWKENYNKVIK